MAARQCDKTLAIVAAGAFALSLAGCNEPIHKVAKNPAPAQEITAGPEPEPEPTPAPEPKKKEDNFIVGKRTTDIVDAKQEQAKGAVASTPKVVGKDPITVSGSAYIYAIGKTSIDQIQHAMDLYKAENDRYPRDFEEFQAGILRPNNIALPQLPSYQKYGYDAEQHKLIILEYPH